MPITALPPPPDPPAIVAPVEINHGCVIGAAAYYRLPPELIVAIRIQEAGTVGRYSVNKNGTVDLGPMQINSGNLRRFEKHGISGGQILGSECVNLYAGAWMLYDEIRRAPDMWTGIGNYHSRTAVYHNRYRASVAKWIERLYKSYRPYIAWLRSNAEAQAFRNSAGSSKSSPSDEAIADARR